MGAAPLDAALGALERRLDASSPAPIATAFSGGGDSLALLLAAKAFASRCGRPLVALHVDHGLQPQSAAWADGAEAAAGRLGVQLRRLAWKGDKPSAGLPAAARAARHRLIAGACRELGAAVCLFGHTLDDQLENALMRGAGAPVGPLRPWSPSPVWPQGRGLFLCRPLLALRRSELRAWLAGEGMAWLEDPANSDLRYARPRARLALAGGAPAEPLCDPGLADLRGLWRVSPWGGVVIERDSLLRADPGRRLRLLQMAAACASGAESLARPARAGGVLRRLQTGERFIASLGGARIEAGPQEIVVEREAGEAARGGLRPVVLAPGRAQVWDGRFELLATQAPVRVEALRGQAGRLCGPDRVALRGVAASARPALPVFRTLGARTLPPRLALARPDAHIGDNGVRCRALSEDRLLAASGVVTKEAQIGTIARMANAHRPPYVETGSKD